MQIGTEPLRGQYSVQEESISDALLSTHQSTYAGQRGPVLGRGHKGHEGEIHSGWDASALQGRRSHAPQAA